MDVYKTHGAFSWSELLTTDPEAASQFYGKLFGWNVKTMGPEMGNYRVANVGEQGVGGIMAIPDDAKAQGMPPRWGCYVTVTDVDQTLQQAEAMGAKIFLPAMDVPTSVAWAASSTRRAPSSASCNTRRRLPAERRRVAGGAEIIRAP